MERKLSDTDYARVVAAIANSQHLRGGGRILDLTFTHVEDLWAELSEVYRELRKSEARIEQLQQSWCYRVKQWFKRAIA